MIITAFTKYLILRQGACKTQFWFDRVDSCNSLGSSGPDASDKAHKRYVHMDQLEMVREACQDRQDRWNHLPALTVQAPPQAIPWEKYNDWWFRRDRSIKSTFSFASFLSFSFLTIFSLNLSLYNISLRLLFFRNFSFCFFERRTISSSVDDSLLASAWSDSVLLSSLEPEMMSLSPLLVSAQPSLSLVPLIWVCNKAIANKKNE